MPSIEDVNHLQIPLQDILQATDGFDSENFIGEGGYGTVYKGISEKHGRIAIKWLVRRQEFGQGEHEFKTEIAMLSKYKHENIVSLLGFCDEEDEKMLVYRYESNGSLDRHLNNQHLTWIQRLHICLDAARGLKCLHDNVGSQPGIVHRDVKSSNILLDGNWKAKISDFGLSRAGPTNPETSYIISNACGTHGYIDPDYRINGYLTQKSDVYSFGVVLFEVMCGRLAYSTWYNDDRRSLSVLVEKHYNRGTLDSIIPYYLRKQMNTDSLHSFSNIAYQCLKNREERPTMKEVMDRLQEVLDHQLEVKKPEKEQKVEEEAIPVSGDERNAVDLSYPSRSPLGQDIILSTHMHCEDCAKKVRQYLKGFEGVESVLTNCETHRVIVKGEKVDPLKVLKRLQKKIRKKVEFVPPEYILSVKKKDEVEIAKAEGEAKPAIGDKRKKEVSKDPPQEDFIRLSMDCFCEGCVRDVRKYIQRFEGVESVVMDQDNSQVVVKGTFSTAELVEYVYKKTRKRTVTVKQALG